jgi:hypothetical protein
MFFSPKPLGGRAIKALALALRLGGADRGLTGRHPAVGARRPAGATWAYGCGRAVTRHAPCAP